MHSRPATPTPWPVSPAASRCSWPPHGPSAAVAQAAVAWADPSTPHRDLRWRSAWAASTWPICTSPLHPALRSRRCATPPACAPSRSTARPHLPAWPSCGHSLTARSRRRTCASRGPTRPAMCLRACFPAPTTWCHPGWSPACSGRPRMHRAWLWLRGSASAPVCASPCGRWPPSTPPPLDASPSSAHLMLRGAHATPCPRRSAKWWT